MIWYKVHLQWILYEFIIHPFTQSKKDSCKITERITESITESFEIQKYRNTEIQKYRNTEIQKHRKNPRKIRVTFILSLYVKLLLVGYMEDFLAPLDMCIYSPFHTLTILSLWIYLNTLTSILILRIYDAHSILKSLFLLESLENTFRLLSMNAGLKIWIIYIQ